MFWIPTAQQKQTAFSAAAADAGDDALQDKESWRIRFSKLVGTEIYDLAWSPQGDALIVGGTDFVARIINAADGELETLWYGKANCMLTQRFLNARDIARHYGTRDHGPQSSHPGRRLGPAERVHCHAIRRPRDARIRAAAGP